MRKAKISRITTETRIELELNLDGTGKSEIDTGIGFLNHMLTLLSKHSHYDLSILCQGDTEVDDHHSTEDIAIALGDAFRTAIGNKAGINRYGSMILPMDEALIMCAIDISGRSCLRYNVTIPNAKVGSFDTELVEEFMKGFVRKAEITLHIQQLDGKNTHHIIEAIFKALGRSLNEATAINSQFRDEIPSTKGVL